MKIIVETLAISAGLIPIFFLYIRGRYYPGGWFLHPIPEKKRTGAIKGNKFHCSGIPYSHRFLLLKEAVSHWQIK